MSLNVENMTQVGLTDVLLAIRADPENWVRKALVIPQEINLSSAGAQELADMVHTALLHRRDAIGGPLETANAALEYRKAVGALPAWVRSQL